MSRFGFCRLVVCAAFAASSVDGATSIDSTNAYSWSANTGWWNWRGDGDNGVNLGAYIVQGYIWAANVGWIDLGRGNPANHIQYQNNSATDYGVNFTIDPNNSAHGLLRGFAYGANIGWINFEDAGNPYVIISTGQLQGYAWGANIGWINLGDMNLYVQTDSIDPGVDTDGDGLPDAWEYQYFGNLAMGANDDPDGDGESNLSEYKAQTNPTDPNSIVHSARLLNISTRMQVLTGENALIGGFIITGAENKKTLARAIGPSLGAAGVANALQDPMLELHDNSGAVVAANDNWQDDEPNDIEATGAPPSDPHEAAIVQTLAPYPQSYTAVVRGVNDSTGVGLVELYDLQSASPTKLANISTRGFVDTGDNVMIGGFIVGAGLGNNGAGSTRVLVRGIGPSLTNAGVASPLQDPALELHDSNGAIVAENDNWKDNQQAEIEATTIPPSDDHESAIVKVLTSGAYTAVLRGVANTTGVALVEAYSLP